MQRRRTRVAIIGGGPAASLGILADVAPSSDELVAALHPDGFAIERQWTVQQFSKYMTDLLHTPGSAAPEEERAFRFRSRLGRLRHVDDARHAQQAIAEQYTGVAIR